MRTCAMQLSWTKLQSYAGRTRWYNYVMTMRREKIPRPREHGQELSRINFRCRDDNSYFKWYVRLTIQITHTFSRGSWYNLTASGFYNIVCRMKYVRTITQCVSVYPRIEMRNKSIHEVRFKYDFTLANHFIPAFDFGLQIFLFLHFRSYDFAEYLFSVLFFFSIAFRDWTRCARVVDRCVARFISPPHAIHWAECGFSFRGIADTTAHQLNGIGNSCTE